MVRRYKRRWGGYQPNQKLESEWLVMKKNLQKKEAAYKAACKEFDEWFKENAPWQVKLRVTLKTWGYAVWPLAAVVVYFCLGFYFGRTL